MAEVPFNGDLNSLFLQARTLGQALTEGYEGMLDRLGDVPDGITLGFREGPKVTLNELFRITWLGGYMSGINDGRMIEQRIKDTVDPALVREAQSLAKRFSDAIAEQD